MKGKRTDFGGADCAIARALNIIGDWWSLLIVREAFHGRQRFGEFQKRLGLAKNILSSRLKKLVQEGIFSTEKDDLTSGHRYVLTPKGENLCIVLIALWQWGEAHCFAPGELPSEMIDTRRGRPLQVLHLRDSTGRRIGPREFRLAAKSSRPADRAGVSE
jgi:DNA-binding HxlR family transcriptional regulator